MSSPTDLSFEGSSLTEIAPPDATFIIPDSRARDGSRCTATAGFLNEINIENHDIHREENVVWPDACRFELTERDVSWTLREALANNAAVRLIPKTSLFGCFLGSLYNYKWFRLVRKAGF